MIFRQAADGTVQCCPHSFRMVHLFIRSLFIHSFIQFIHYPISGLRLRANPASSDGPETCQTGGWLIGNPKLPVVVNVDVYNLQPSITFLTLPAITDTDHLGVFKSCLV